MLYKKEFEILQEYVDQHKFVYEDFSVHLPEVVICLAELILNCLHSGGTVYTFGNGGSASDAMHFVGELVGRFEKNRDPIRAVCLNTNVSNLTAIANDYGYEYIFEREVKALVKSNDVVVGFTTSGESKNVINAFLAAKEKKAKIVCFTGLNNNSTASLLADKRITVPCSRTSIVQEMHIIVIHMLAKIIEENFKYGYDKNNELESTSPH